MTVRSRLKKFLAKQWYPLKSMGPPQFSISRHGKYSALGSQYTSTNSLS
jgi:hypothetical protein